MSLQVVGESPLDLCNCRALRRAARRVTQFYDDKLAPTALRATQFTLLSAVRARGQVSVNELAEILDLDRTTTGKNVLPLERLGFVEVSASKTDARSRQVKLTRKGIDVLARAHVLWQQAQEEFEAANGTSQSAALRDALANIR